MNRETEVPSMHPTIREIQESDLCGLLQLYTHLHDNPFPDPETCRPVWEAIRRDPNHHVFVADSPEDGLVSSCVLIIVPNLTHAQRPYGLIENVVTDPRYRDRGLATACLTKAADTAGKAGCYKLMLLTGSKEESTLHFYERAGFNRSDKTGFVRWL